MNLSELRTRVRSISGIEMPTLKSDAEVDAVINEVYQEIIDSARWPFREAVGTVATVAGTAEYDLPPEVESPRTVTVEDSDVPGPVPLQEVSRAWVDRYVDDADEDTPQVYAKTDADSFVVAPTPDAVYTLQVRGWTSVPELATDSDVPVFADRYHAAIAYGAAAVLLDEEGQDKRAEKALTRAATFLNRMRDFYMQSDDDEPVVVGGAAAGSPVAWRGRLWPGRVA